MCPLKLQRCGLWRREPSSRMRNSWWTTEAASGGRRRSIASRASNVVRLRSVTRWFSARDPLDHARVRHVQSHVTACVFLTLHPSKISRPDPAFASTAPIIWRSNRCLAHLLARCSGNPKGPRLNQQRELHEAPLRPPLMIMSHDRKSRSGVRHHNRHQDTKLQRQLQRRRSEHRKPLHFYLQERQHLLAAIKILNGALVLLPLPQLLRPPHALRLCAPSNLITRQARSQKLQRVSTYYLPETLGERSQASARVRTRQATRIANWMMNRMMKRPTRVTIHQVTDRKHIDL